MEEEEGRKEQRMKREGERRWRDAEEAETGKWCEKVERKRGAWKGAKGTIRCSEGQIKSKRQGRGEEKRKMYQEKED